MRKFLVLLCLLLTAISGVAYFADFDVKKISKAILGLTH
jgi:hypothetical protein